MQSPRVSLKLYKTESDRTQEAITLALLRRPP